MEDDIHDPVETVFDVPVAADRSGEEAGIERIHHIVERVMAGDTILVGQDAAQKILPIQTPLLDLDNVIPKGVDRNRSTPPSNAGRAASAALGFRGAGRAAPWA